MDYSSPHTHHPRRSIKDNFRIEMFARKHGKTIAQVEEMLFKIEENRNIEVVKSYRRANEIPRVDR